MNVFTLASRVAVAAPFVYLGWQAARQPGGRVKAAEAFGVPADLSDLAVRANGAAMVAGGLAVATGVLPRLGAAGVLAALVPTTLAGHPFWKETDPQARAAQLTQALKNLGMAGGLLAVVAAPRDRTTG